MTRKTLVARITRYSHARDCLVTCACTCHSFASDLSLNLGRLAVCFSRRPSTLLNLHDVESPPRLPCDSDAACTSVRFSGTPLSASRMS